MVATAETPPTPETPVAFRYYLETVACFGGHPAGIDREVYVFESGQESTGRPALGVRVGSKVVWVTIPTDKPESEDSVAVLPAREEREWMVIEKDNVINPVPATSTGDQKFDRLRDQIPDRIRKIDCIIPEPKPEQVDEFRQLLGR